jgi:hypothetical protein
MALAFLTEGAVRVLVGPHMLCWVGGRALRSVRPLATERIPLR